LSFVLLVIFWFAIRPSVPEAAVQSWVIGIVAVGLMVGVVNAARYTRKKYRRKAEVQVRS
jgi:membrane-associated PAP2 superfamily phosphatase